MRAILTWHSLDTSESPISVAPEVFRAQAQFLASGRVRVLSLIALTQAPEDAGDAVALTFDDGFTNIAEQALPLLLELGLPATVFVVTDHVGKTNAWGGRVASGIPTLPLMDWDTLATWEGRGIDVGAHTRRHVDLTTVSGATLEDEIVGSAEHIAGTLGRRPEAFAYPYGRVSSEAARIARASYRAAVTTELGALRQHDDSARFPRLDMYYLRQPGLLEQWGAPAFRRRLWLRAQGRRVRQLISPSAPTGSLA